MMWGILDLPVKKVKHNHIKGSTKSMSDIDNGVILRVSFQIY